MTAPEVHLTDIAAEDRTVSNGNSIEVNTSKSRRTALAESSGREESTESGATSTRRPEDVELPEEPERPNPIVAQNGADPVEGRPGAAVRRRGRRHRINQEDARSHVPTPAVRFVHQVENAPVVCTNIDHRRRLGRLENQVQLLECLVALLHRERRESRQTQAVKRESLAFGSRARRASLNGQLRNGCFGAADLRRLPKIGKRRRESMRQPPTGVPSLPLREQQLREAQFVRFSTNSKTSAEEKESTDPAIDSDRASVLECWTNTENIQPEERKDPEKMG